jgi:DNA-binding transcriptional LysR family regulator
MLKVTRVHLKTTHLNASLVREIDWDDIRIFVVAARLGSIRAAAAETGQTVLTIRRRLDLLERQVNAILLRRSAKGVELTEDGRMVFDAGLEMLRPARRLGGIGAKRRQGLRSSVKIGITEGLGTFWLIPRVVDLHRTHPNIQVDIQCSMSEPDVSALEVDIAIMLNKPKDPELKVIRLGWLHIVFFASQSYVSENGELLTKEELPDHNYIAIVGEQIQSKRVFSEINQEDQRKYVNIRLNTSSGQLMAVMYGAGVAGLPTYAPLVSHSLVHVAREYSFPRDIWLAFHPHAAEFEHVRKVIDWVRGAFDNTRYPWFREKFISPAEIEAIAKERGLSPMFAAFKE